MAMFASQHGMSLLKRDLLSKERIKIPSFQKLFPFSVDPFSAGSQNNFDRVAPMKVYHFPSKLKQGLRIRMFCFFESTGNTIEPQ